MHRLFIINIVKIPLNKIINNGSPKLLVYWVTTSKFFPSNDMNAYMQARYGTSQYLY